MTKIQHEEFKNRFRELVEPLGLSKTQCAKVIGISYKTFDNIYNYGSYPRINTAIKIANYFNVSLHYLLGKTDVNNRKGTR